ncbi:hypothetical protein F8388_011250 [Cannabis sativa]|uniref:Alpha-N-acetylglucosaminidase n=1 Tax=Cannabis sativa TaxID=3483 RepID=A0A7J6FA75_CANSA|nr:hypothetical protein F8388_011250 [Cannabis sativa]
MASSFPAILFTLFLLTSLTFPTAHPSTIGVRHLSNLLQTQDRERSPPSLQLAAARGVLRRLIPSHSSSFDFQIVSKEHCGGASCFIIRNHPDFHRRGGDPEILIIGVTGVDIVAGLHWYLKNWCGSHISWDKTGGAQLCSVPKAGLLPRVDDNGVFVPRPVPWSYYQNAVSSSYSFAWWDWERWEKEIDWMALQGINLPLAFTGQEAIWQKVFQKFNMSSKDLDDFFGGPAFLAWSRMGNLHGWGGPLPQSWLDQQLLLQKKILRRMYELGMTPGSVPAEGSYQHYHLLPAFSGNVPAALKSRFPSAKITRLGNWFTVKSDPRWCCTYLLDATDPLFVEIGRAFIEQQLEEYGKMGHIYNCDTFDENTPPVDDPEYISSLGAAIFRGMQSGDSNAVWLMQRKATKLSYLRGVSRTFPAIHYNRGNKRPNSRLVARGTAMPTGTGEDIILTGEAASLTYELEKFLVRDNLLMLDNGVPNRGVVAIVTEALGYGLVTPYLRPTTVQVVGLLSKTKSSRFILDFNPRQLVTVQAERVAGGKQTGPEFLSDEVGKPFTCWIFDRGREVTFDSFRHGLSSQNHFGALEDDLLKLAFLSACTICIFWRKHMI